jgi:hypothetical protein
MKKEPISVFDTVFCVEIEGGALEASSASLHISAAFASFEYPTIRRSLQMAFN